MNERLAAQIDRITPCDALLFADERIYLTKRVRLRGTSWDIRTKSRWFRRSGLHIVTEAEVKTGAVGNVCDGAQQR